MIVPVTSRWERMLLVCAKCEKKLGKHGFGPDGKQRLSKALRTRAGGKGAKRRSA